MAQVYTARPAAGSPFLGAPERGFYRLLGVDAAREQDWKGYAKTVLIFSVVFSVVLYAIRGSRATSSSTRTASRAFRRTSR